MVAGESAVSPTLSSTALALEKERLIVEAAVTPVALSYFVQPVRLELWLAVRAEIPPLQPDCTNVYVAALTLKTTTSAVMSAPTITASRTYCFQ